MGKCDACEHICENRFDERGTIESVLDSAAVSRNPIFLKGSGRSIRAYKDWDGKLLILRDETKSRNITKEDLGGRIIVHVVFHNNWVYYYIS